MLKLKNFGLTDYNFVNSTGLNNKDLFGYRLTGGPLKRI